MPLNKALLGKVYADADPWTVEEAATRAYAHATNTSNAAYLDAARAGGVVLAEGGVHLVDGARGKPLRAQAPVLQHADTF